MPYNGFICGEDSRIIELLIAQFRISDNHPLHPQFADAARRVSIGEWVISVSFGTFPNASFTVGRYDRNARSACEQAAKPQPICPSYSVSSTLEHLRDPNLDDGLPCNFKPLRPAIERL